MQNIFISLLNTSITAGYLVIAVMLLRPLLKKAPKYIRCILWGLVGLRLILPFSFESVLSLIPSAEPIPPEIVTSPAPVIHSGITFVNSAVNPVISQSFAPAPEASVNPMQVVMAVAWNVWLLGVIAMVLYSVISFVLLKRKLRESVPVGKGIREADGISSPFVLGRTIYLPANLNPEERSYILLHEQLHLRHGDPAVKLLFWLAVCLHWFNPLVWLSFFLCARDMELRCDEAVLGQLGGAIRSDYAQSLLNCAAGRRFAPVPLAFGEGDTGKRVRFVLKWKKAKLWIAVPAAVLCAVVSLGVVAAIVLAGRGGPFRPPVVETPPPETETQDPEKDYEKQKSLYDGIIAEYTALLTAKQNGEALSAPDTEGMDEREAAIATALHGIVDACKDAEVAKTMGYGYKDMDGNGKLNTDDAVYLLLHVMFGAEDYPIAA